MVQENKNSKPAEVGDNTRVVVLSDICIGSDTYRPNLLKTIADYVQTTESHFILIAGGLFDGDTISKQIRRYTKKLNKAKRVLEIAYRRLLQAEKAKLNAPKVTKPKTDAEIGKEGERIKNDFLNSI